MIVDIVDKYRTDDNNPIKNLRLKKKKVVENAYSDLSNIARYLHLRTE